MNIITCSAYMYMYNNSGIWAASLLSKMNYVKCRGTTKPRCLPEKFDKIKEQFLQDILTTVVMEEMPCELIISWDLTGPRIILDDGAVWYKASGNCWFGGPKAGNCCYGWDVDWRFSPSTNIHWKNTCLTPKKCSPSPRLAYYPLTKLLVQWANSEWLCC